jgi:hypothetical protein
MMIGCENKEVPAPKYDDVMNVKLLLKEICQFLDIANCENSNMAGQIRHLASKVLFALSVNNFNAVFSRISGRLQVPVSNIPNPQCTTFLNQPARDLNLCTVNVSIPDI